MYNNVNRRTVDLYNEDFEFASMHALGNFNHVHVCCVCLVLDPETLIGRGGTAPCNWCHPGPCETVPGIVVPRRFVCGGGDGGAYESARDCHAVG